MEEQDTPDVEINVESAPEETPGPDESDVSESVAVAAGEAIATAQDASVDAAKAENAAEVAQHTADEAAQLAAAAATEAVQASARFDELERKVDALGGGLAQVLDALGDIKEGVENTLPGTQFPTAPPEDTAPKSGHWLTRKVGGRG